mmetsp:Transcript_25788/g.29485  ORF Transcript_25788/g.29485 Transcript_25788/m.29485 type:complete len:259 (+) Transcript_25788:38-814(+)
MHRFSQPEKRIRATFNESTIRVYQAYNDTIADAALASQSFQGPLEAGIWSKTRMTWIKPSKLWMAYRCGWTVLKDKNQARVLALDISRPKFEKLLLQARITSHQNNTINKGESSNENNKETHKHCLNSDVVVQWDPERKIVLGKDEEKTKGGNKDCYTYPVPSLRSIQIGLRGSAVEEILLDTNSIVKITDVTEDFRDALIAIKDGDEEKAKLILWHEEEDREKVMEMPDPIVNILGITNKKKIDSVIVLDSTITPPH